MLDQQLLGVVDVARRTGLSRKALRLYEEMGLVEPAERTEAGYRRYDDEALRRIELVGRAKALGLSLAETREFIAVAEDCCGSDHHELEELVHRKLEETAQRLGELTALLSTLEGVKARLEANHGTSYCEDSLCTCRPLVIGPKPATAADASHLRAS
ncbi:MAG: MerR family transcriptional regulator [Acidimicrobiales bacterium]